MSGNIKSSIIIPVFNQEKLVKKTVLSVLNQDINSNFEVLIIDDGSTDTTFDIINSIAADDIRVKIYKQKHSGVSAARNLGIENCLGDYILFLDSDDLIFKNYLQSQIETLEDNTNSDIAICPHVTLSNNDKTFTPGFFYKNLYNLHIFANTITPFHCCLFRRSVINKLKDFDTHLSGLEDYDFMFRAALSNFSFIPNYSTIAIYRYHNKNSSTNINWKNMCYLIASKFDKIINSCITNYKFINLYGLSSIYIVFASSIIGYAFKYKNISQQKETALLIMAIKYILLASSCNDIKNSAINAVILYTHLIRIIAVQYKNCKPLSKALEQFAKIFPQAFACEATQATLKKLSSDNYIPLNDIISIFTTGVPHIRHLL